MIDWPTFLTRVSFPGLLPAVAVRYADSPYGPLLVITRQVLPHEVSAAYPALPFTRDMSALRYIRELVGGNFRHEVDEALQLDGRVVFNPHGC